MLTQTQYHNLVIDLNKASRAYYVDDNPIMPDTVYDKLYKELESYEASTGEINPNSPTQRVGDSPVDELVKVTHAQKMMSLTNTFNVDDLRAFDARVRKDTGLDEIDYTCEMKIDGLSISLIYQDGELVRAVTRGDGFTGEDVTANIRTFYSIPKRLVMPIDAEFRGEVYMPKRSFAAANADRVANGETPFANCRNAAAGSLRLRDPKVTAKRKLDSFIYTMIADVDAPESQSEALDAIASYGFNVEPNHVTVTGIDAVVEYITEWETKRKDLGYDTDGVVVKVDSTSIQEELGSNSKAPRWATSFKFEEEEFHTKLLGVEWQVSRNRVLTPVAELEPVTIAGTVVRRATLHNADFIRDMDIRIGSTVIVKKSGEVIPKIVGLVPALQPDVEFSFPTECPSCGSPVEYKDISLVCTNSSCESSIHRSIEHFARREGMNIMGLGGRIVEQLVDAGLVNHFTDLYQLKSDDLVNLDKFGEKKTAKLLAEIEKTKTRELPHVLASLGIPFVGLSTAKVIAQHFTLPEIKSAPVEELSKLDGIGIETAEGIVTWCKSHGDVIDTLISQGVNPPLTVSNTARRSLSGVFVITGSFENHSRSELKNLIEAAGGKVTSSVSAKTTYLVAGNKAGSKLAKAQELGVRILDEAGVAKLLA